VKNIYIILLILLMKNKYCLLFIAILTLLIFQSCESESPSGNDSVIIGIASDVQSLNPANSISITEGNITELLYLSLFQHRWNEKESTIDVQPMLAQKWEWNSDSTSLLIHLRDDVLWTDGKKCTAEDVVFSFDIYSDPDVQTRLFNTFDFLYSAHDLSIDIEKTFSIISPYVLKINFPPGSVPSFYRISFPILPKHIYEKADRKNFAASSAGFKIVSNGAYSLHSWKKDQAIILHANKKSFLYRPSSVPELIFKIIPDYTSRLTQLRKGEIDMMEDIRPEDINTLKKEEHLNIVPVKGREYEYIGWSNIDQEKFNNSGIVVPHKLFGSSAVRKALTIAINRNEILEEYLYGYGQLANGPVSPIFKKAADTSLQPYPFNPDSALKILNMEGWADKDEDGILEKGNREFRFKLYIPAGNPRREFTAAMIKNNLKAVGIDVTIDALEMGTFIDNMFGRKFDAWLVSWFISLPPDLKSFWYSDLKSMYLNNAGYRDKKADMLLSSLEEKISIEKQDSLYREIQGLLYNDQPVTFLYWTDNITAYNKRIKNMNIDPLGFIHHCWEWSVKN
jgi:peptide/nickel transport system substrate-binding protein